MLSKEIFTRGIQMMNAVIIKPIDTDDTMDMYYLVLKDLEEKSYLEGMLHLVKTKEYIQTPFSPREIRQASELFSKDNEAIEYIMTKIYFDIIKFGSNRKPNYKKEIEEAITKAGGWYALCFSEGKELESVKNNLKEGLKEAMLKNPILLEKIESAQKVLEH